MDAAQLACAVPLFLALCAAIWRFGRLEGAVHELSVRVSALETRSGCSTKTPRA